MVLVKTAPLVGSSFFHYISIRLHGLIRIVFYKEEMPDLIVRLFLFTFTTH